MNKNILVGFVGLLLLVGLVSAGLFPQPVAGKIELVGYPQPEGLAVEQTNLRTGLSYISKVDESGFYLIDWGNLPYLEGDQVKITIPACRTNSLCSQVVSLNGDPQFAHFNIPALAEVITEVNYYVCPNKSIVTDPAKCPIVPPVPPVEVIKEVIKEVPVVKEVVKEVIVKESVFVCSDGTSVETEEECPVSNQTLLKGLVAVLGVFSLAMMVLFYTNRKKYKWVPGFVGIVNKEKQQAEELIKKGKDKEAEKKIKSTLKKIETVRKRHLGDKG